MSLAVAVLFFDSCGSFGRRRTPDRPSVQQNDEGSIDACAPRPEGQNWMAVRHYTSQGTTILPWRVATGLRMDREEAPVVDGSAGWAGLGWARKRKINREWDIPNVVVLGLWVS